MHSSLTVPEIGKLECKVLAVSVSGEGLLLGLYTAFFSLSPCMGEGAGELSGIASIRALSPFTRALPHDLITPQRPSH